MLPCERKLKRIGLDLQRVLQFTAHDGAPNMAKTSKLLRATYFQHCVALSMHFLRMFAHD